MKPRRLPFAVALLAAFPALATLATPRKSAARPRVPTPKAAQTRPMPVLSMDASRAGASGYPAVVLGEPVQRFHGEPITLELKEADHPDVLQTI